MSTSKSKTVFFLSELVLISKCILLASASQDVLVLSEGGSPTLSVVTSDGYECQNITLPDIPQPFGSPGRIGSLSGYSQDGTMIVCGGLDNSGHPISSFQDCQLLDLLTRTWSEAAPMPELIAFSGFVTVENKLYSFGGHHTKLNGPGPTMYAYTNRIYYLDFSDLEAGWKESETKLPRNSSRLCATSHEDFIYLIGADISGSFNVETEEWADIPSLQHSDIGCEILTNEFNQSTLLAIGGSTGNEVWGLDLDRNSTTPIWVNLGIDIPTERRQGPTISNLNNRLLISGGSTETGDIELLTEYGWETVTNGMKTPRYAQSHAKAKATMFPECQASVEELNLPVVN